MNEQEIKKTILLVEDEALIAVIEKEMLKKHGFNVILASSGEKAIEIARTSPHINLILMDINLGKGKMDGTEAAEIILKEKDIPIIFLSSYTQPEVVEKAERITSYGYATKDSGETVLITSIKMAFKLHEAHRKVQEREKLLQESETLQRTLLENMPAGVIIVDPVTRTIENVNNAAAAMFGIQAEHIIGHRCHTFLCPASEGMCPVCDLGQGVDNSEREMLCSDGSRRPVLKSVKRIQIQGQEKLLECFLDITEHKQVERFLKDVITKNPMSIQILDKEGLTIEVNSSYKLLFGSVPPPDYSIFNDLQLREKGMGKFFDELRNGATVRFPDTYFNAHDSIPEFPDVPAWIRTIGFPLNNSNEKPERFVLMHENITERRQAEDALKEKEATYRSLSNLLRLLCDNVPDMIWAKDIEKRFIFANKAICRDLLNAADTDEPIGKNDMFFAERERARHADNPEWHTFGEICRDTDAITMDAGKPQQFDEHGNVQGKFLFLDVHKAPFIDEKGNMIGTVGSARDVTVAKVLEECLTKSSECYRRLSEDMPCYVSAFLPDSTLTYANKALAGMTGLRPEEMIGLRFFDMLPPDDLAVTRQQLASLTPENPVETHEQSHISPDGSKFWQQWTNRAFFDDNGLLIHYQAVGMDITERKLAEDRVKSLLSEKELLLREAHHRIKNNMNAVVSLLSLQTDTSRDPSVIAALKDAGSRVRSMMVLYDKLYRSADFREISAKDYLNSLIDEIVINFPNQGQVRVEKQIDDFILDANILSPLGIILNELLTNAIKHAFTGRDKGEIAVSLSINDNHATLMIQDNGTGIPELIAASTGFGMQLVNLLAEQLEGTIAIEREKGTKFVLEFEV